MKAIWTPFVLLSSLVVACGAVEPSTANASASSDAGTTTNGQPSVDRASDGGEPEPRTPDAAAPPAAGTGSWSVGSKSWTGSVTCAVAGDFFIRAEGGEVGRAITFAFKAFPRDDVSYAVNPSGVPESDADVAVVVEEGSATILRTALSGSVRSTSVEVPRAGGSRLSVRVLEWKDLPAALDGKPDDVQLLSGTVRCPL